MPTRPQFETEAEWLAHLRIWFAGQALAGLSMTWPQMNKADDQPARIAHLAYTIADAMIAERSKP